MTVGGELDKRLRWRFAKLVILSWARKENLQNEDIKNLSEAITEAYSKSSSGSSILLDELAHLCERWPIVEKGILFLNGEGDVDTFSILTERERAIIADVALQDKKRFLKDCYRKEELGKRSKFIK